MFSILPVGKTSPACIIRNMLATIWKRVVLALTILRSAFRGWRADRASLMAAAVTFYTLISIAPLLMILLTFAGW